MIKRNGEIEGGRGRRRVSCPEDLCPCREPAPPHSPSLQGPLPGIAVRIGENEDRQRRGEFERKRGRHVDQGNGILLRHGRGINFTTIDLRTFTEAVQSRKPGEVGGGPAFDRTAMELDAPPLNQDHVGR